MKNNIQTNRSILLITQVLMMIVLFSTCTDKEDKPDYYVNTPIAGFDWTGNDGPAPVSVQFVNTSEFSDKFDWDFGDGQISAEHSPLHTFNNFSSEPKTFLVVLKATDTESGLFQRRSRVIEVLPNNGKK